MSYKDITAVIPVRLGSTRIKDKVLLPFNYKGKKVTLLDLKILQLKESLNSENIIISCGEKKLSDIAESHNCQVSWRENKYIEPNYKVSTEELIREAIKDVKTKYIAWSPVVSPLHSGEIFNECFDFFLNTMESKYNSLVTVSDNYHYFWYGDKPVNYSPDKNHVQSQLLRPLKKVTNGLYLTSYENMYKAGYFLGDKPFLYSVPEQCSIDIDTYFDYRQALFFDGWKDESN